LDCSVDWIATTYSVADGTKRCDKENVVVPKASFTYTAACVDGWAQASVYIYDNNFNSTDNPVVPEYCGDDVDVIGNKIAYNFSIPCECDEGPNWMETSPSPAPTSICEYYDISFDNEDVASGLYVSTQWKEYGLRLSAEELVEGQSGGFMPNGYPRLFNTSVPVDSKDYGTPGLKGDYGNVLIVQQTGGNAQWKANEAGGTIVFKFMTPVEEFLEIGVLNVVEDVWIQAIDSSGDTKAFVLEPSPTLPNLREVVMDVPLVSKLVVKMAGPSAVSHISICSDFKSTPTSESWPTDLPSTVPSKSPAPSSSPSTSAAPSLNPTSTPSVVPSAPQRHRRSQPVCLVSSLVLYQQDCHP